MGERRRARIGLVLGLAVGPWIVGGLGGCGGSGHAGTRARVINESSTAVLAAAWLERAATTAESERLIEAGSSASWDLVPVGEGDGAAEGVVFRVAPATTSGGGGPVTALMDAPGPFVLRVRGSAAGLQLLRGAGEGAEVPRVPPDPRQRGMHDDLPPVR